MKATLSWLFPGVTEVIVGAFEVAITLNAELVASVNVSPVLTVEVRTTPVPELGNVTPVTVKEFVPAAIVPVKVPPIVPAFPLEVKSNVVAAVTFVAVPEASWDSTVTLKPEPANGVVGEIDVMANFVGAATAVVGVTEAQDVPTRIPSISNVAAAVALPCLIRKAVIPVVAASTPDETEIVGVLSTTPNAGLTHKFATSSVVDTVLLT